MEHKYCSLLSSYQGLKTSLFAVGALKSKLSFEGANVRKRNSMGNEGEILKKNIFPKQLYYIT